MDVNNTDTAHGDADDLHHPALPDLPSLMCKLPVFISCLCTFIQHYSLQITVASAHRSCCYGIIECCGNHFRGFCKKIISGKFTIK